MPTLLRRRGIATFALLVVVTEVTGRSFTARVDRALHVAPLANSGTSYYPLFLVVIKVVGALAVALLLARATRARAAAEAGSRLLTAFGHGQRRAPRLRTSLSPRIWLASFAATSALYLLQADAEGAAAGRWPLFSPLLHTYSLPVFAALSVVVAFAWSFARWLHEVEDFAHHTLERVRRILTAAAPPRSRYARPGDDTAPRRRFGLAFECRPPPLPA
jgi:hypothetical protein